jgi:hypothetical protein
MATTSTRFLMKVPEGTDTFDNEQYLKGNLNIIDEKAALKADLDGLLTTGSNANGDYVRYSNGIQICWFTHTYPNTAANAWTATLIGDTYYVYFNTTWTFPAAFKTGSIPIINVSGGITGSQPETHTGYNVSPASCTIEHGGYKSGLQDTTPSLNRYYQAIGWWK